MNRGNFVVLGRTDSLKIAAMVWSAAMSLKYNSDSSYGTVVHNNIGYFITTVGGDFVKDLPLPCGTETVPGVILPLLPAVAVIVNILAAKLAEIVCSLVTLENS